MKCLKTGILNSSCTIFCKVFNPKIINTKNQNCSTELGPESKSNLWFYPGEKLDLGEMRVTLMGTGWGNVIIPAQSTNAQYESSQVFLNHCFETVVLYTRSWFIQMFYQIDLFIKVDNFNSALLELEKIFKNQKYKAFNDMEKKERNTLQALINQGKSESKITKKK